MRINSACLLLLISAISCNSKEQKNTHGNIDSTAKTEVASTILPVTDRQVMDVIKIKDTGTFKLGEYSLTFNPTLTIYNPKDSSVMPHMYADDVERQKLIDSFGNWHENAMKVEKYLTGKYKDHFSRKGNVLTLKLANGKTLALNEKNNVGESYSFENYFPEIDYYLIRVQYDEGNTYLLVNRKNGYKKYVFGQIRVSPSQTQIASVNSDFEAGYSENGIQLFAIQGDTLACKFQATIDANWGPANIKWINENQLHILN